MAFSHYIQSGGKRLRCGFTTGTCAALAAAGAARLLLTGKAPEQVSLITPKGLRVEVPLEDCSATETRAVCAVRKDAGDDIDATDGLLIYAAVEKAPSGIVIDGGQGVGRVTKPGLDQSVGSAAINRVPRRMIREALEDVAGKLCYEGGFQVTVFVPQGEEAAKKTFNEDLGIMGGISILGTSGIVEPMSMQALIDTLALELRQHAALGSRRLILTPGNYGLDFLRRQGLDALGIPVVKCSNFLGDALDQAASCGYEEVLLVGHIGKLVKLAGGVMNTHSRYADCRTELLCAHAAVRGADRNLCRRLMDAATTEACLDLLTEAGLREPVMDSLLLAMDRHVRRRAAGVFRVGVMVFSNTYGLLGRTEGAKELIEAWKP